MENKNGENSHQSSKVEAVKNEEQGASPASPKKRENKNSQKNSPKKSPLLEPPFPPHHIAPIPPQQNPPNSSRPLYGKYDLLPPLVPNNHNPDNNAYVEPHKSDDYKKRNAYFDKKNKMFVQGLVKQYKKNMPLESYKESQAEKWMSATRNGSQTSTSRHRVRQTQKLPPMETTDQENIDSNGNNDKKSSNNNSLINNSANTNC